MEEEMTDLAESFLAEVTAAQASSILLLAALMSVGHPHASRQISPTEPSDPVRSSYSPR
jgi:hypothetical protein